MLRLIPREKVFFDLFEKAADNARRGAEEVQALFDRFDDLPERAKRVKDIEHAGDELTHEMIERLNQTFITPIDREDIHELAVRLDDIVDLMDTAVNRVLLYKIEKPIEDARALARCLVHATKVICEMLPLMRLMSAKNSDVIRTKCHDVHAQENEGDHIEQHALAALFDGAHEPLYVMKWKNIIEELESATDRCEDVANVIEGIVLKNA
jgi:predicted phosphate transport protein (TIGR00153 family)